MPDSPPPDPRLAAELERWNTRYGTAEYVFGKEPNAFLAQQAARLAPGMTALCVADGEGRNSVWLARQDLRVTAFDYSPVALAKARALADEAGVQVDYHHADVTRWDWTAARYDVVVAIFVQFAGPKLRAKMFAGMGSCLAPGGLLIVQGYGPRQIEFGTGGPKVPENLYTDALLRESFGGLEILHLAAHQDIIHEGGGHAGMSDLVDLVARRQGRRVGA